VEKIAVDKLEDWKKERLEKLADERLLGDHLDAAGKRTLSLAEAVSLMEESKATDFPLAGEKSAKELHAAVAAGPGNFTSYHAEWTRLSGVGEGSAVSHTHRNLCELLRLMHSFDQINTAGLASGELLTRWLIQTEIAAERNPRHPDYSGLDIIISAPVAATGRAVTAKFNTFVTEKLKERSSIWKQERLYREEMRHQGSGRASEDPSGKGKGKSKKKKKKKKEGATAETAEGEA